MNSAEDIQEAVEAWDAFLANAPPGHAPNILRPEDRGLGRVHVPHAPDVRSGFITGWLVARAKKDADDEDDEPDLTENSFDESDDRQDR